MKKSILNLIFLILLPAINGSSESKEDNVSLYTKMYCQTDYVTKEQLIEVSDSSNGFEVLADDVSKVDCAAINEKSSKEIYKQLAKELKKKKYSKKSIDCNIKMLKEAGYDKIRFKINALLGLSLPNQQKAEFRDTFNGEIATAIENSVNECEVPILPTRRIKQNSSSSSSEEFQ